MSNLLKSVLGAAVVLLCLPEVISGKLDKDLELYLVSVPIGYGALSAYHALPSALQHAPFALNIAGSEYLDGTLGRRSYQDENENKEKYEIEQKYPRIEYGLDFVTFLKKLSRQSA